MTLLADGIRLCGFPLLAIAAYQDYQTNLVRRRLWYGIAAVAVLALAVDMALTGGMVVLGVQAVTATIVTGAVGLIMVFAGAGKADGIGLAVLGLWWPHSVGGLVLGALAGLLALSGGVVVGLVVRSGAVSVSPDGEPGTAIPFISVLAPATALAVGMYLVGAMM